jgi:hypothetical protein
MRKTILLTLLALAGCSPSSPFETLPVQTEAAKPGEAIPLVRIAGFNGQPMGTNNILSLAKSANYLFFSVDRTGIYRIPKYGGTPELVAPLSDNQGAQVVVANEQLYWSDFDKILTRPVEGGAIRQLQFAGQYTNWSFTYSGDLQADDKYVYFVARNQDTSGAVWRAPISGGAPEKLYAIPAYPTAVGVSFPYVADSPMYIVDHGDVIFMNPNGLELDIIAAGTSTPKTLASWPTFTDPDAPAVLLGIDGDTIYLERENSDQGQHIGTVSRTMGGLGEITLPPEVMVFPSFVFDANNLYVNSATSQHWRFDSLPRGSSTPTVISADDDQFNGGPDQPILQDEDNLFFASGAGGQIVMLPKKPAGAIQ